MGRYEWLTSTSFLYLAIGKFANPHSSSKDVLEMECGVWYDLIVVL